MIDALQLVDRSVCSDAQEKRALVNEAEREAAEAAQRRRAEEQCARAIEGKLEGHRQTTQTAVHETRSRVEGGLAICTCTPPTSL